MSETTDATIYPGVLFAAAAEVALPLTDTDCGSRDFTLRDPEGNPWAFGTYRPKAS
jgi:uncharacterized glyoxalase superfamily protein PhnB